MSELYLIHHGIKGQKWGERNYQNYDGTLTEAGRRRYAKYLSKELNSLDKAKAKDLGMIKQNVDDISFYNGRRNKAIKRNRSTTKYDDKISQLKLSNDSILSNIENGKKQTNDLLSEAAKYGLNVSTKDVSRSASTKRDIGYTIVSQLLAAGAASSGGAGVGIIRSRSVKGKKYYVN